MPTPPILIDNSRQTGRKGFGDWELNFRNEKQCDLLLLRRPGMGAKA